jgi:hypothetical protein
LDNRAIYSDRRQALPICASLMPNCRHANHMQVPVALGQRYINAPFVYSTLCSCFAFGAAAPPPPPCC